MADSISKKQKNYLVFSTIAVVLLIVGAYFLIAEIIDRGGDSPFHPFGQRIDDWVYNPDDGGSSKGILSGVGSMAKSLGAGGARFAESVSMPSMAYDSIGFSAGGAKDINNFRENIENDYLPLETDITYEGLFYDYYFDTSQEERCDELFCPSYSYAVTQDPFSEKDEYYLSLGLNSGMKESDFKRKKLNLVVVLDISGSMGSPFNRYYYDHSGNRIDYAEKSGSEDDDYTKSKMEIAAKSVVAMLDHLENDDRFGMVVFSTEADVAKPLNLVGETDMDSIRDHILEIRATGSTNMEDGMEKATELFDDVLDTDPDEYENRIIFLTDAMPNTGDTSEHGLLGMTRTNAKDRVYTTFIGIGVDFNTELTEEITKIRGANYYSVHSSSEFKGRMDDEFEYMVTPLVFNLKLELDSDGYRIEKVFGSPEADEATGEIMKVNTLFPSEKQDGETKGGVVIIKLKKLSDDAEFSLKVNYEDRAGNMKSGSKEIKIRDESPEYFANRGIRKAVLLTRYASLMRSWINDERDSYEKGDDYVLRPSVDYEKGIIIPPEPTPPYQRLGRWERQSIPLRVSSHYNSIFEEFAEYFESEMDAIGDDSLKKELDIIRKLADE